MEMKDLIATMPDLEGSFIQELLDTMMAGKFADSDLIKPGNNKVVGEMNSLEKALNILCKKYRDKETEILTYFRGGTNQAHTEKEELEMKRQIITCRSRFKIANEMMWEGIRTRLVNLNEEESNILSICDDFKIVSLLEKRRGWPLTD